MSGEASPRRNPVSPGVSFYERTGAERPSFPPLQGDLRADVAVIGGGFTGLSAALHLAEAGAQVVLVEAARFGDGASGRNGGQIGTGQRLWPEDMERMVGAERARRLFDLAEAAKRHLLELSRTRDIDMDYRPGQISAIHKRRLIPAYRRHVRSMEEKYGYPHLTFLEREETAARIGSPRYHAAIHDAGTGHINPLSLVAGLARAGAAAGALLFEETAALAVERRGGRIAVKTPRGTVTAQRCLIATNAHGESQGKALDPTTAAHVLPIRSFIAATAPLPPGSKILPQGEACHDSRFMVRYFRKSADNRLIFGGREAYGADGTAGLERHMRRQITEVFPQLADIPITDLWGGSVAITMRRLPFVRETAGGVTAIAGFSGHGIALANYCGRLYAETVTGGRDRLAPLRDLGLTPFPGGERLRKPLLFLAMHWFALRDRL